MISCKLGISLALKWYCLVDFILSLVAPRVGVVLHRIGLTILCVVYAFHYCFVYYTFSVCFKFDQMSQHVIGHLKFWYTKISIGIRAGILFCFWVRSWEDNFWKYGKGRFVLKSCLNMVSSYCCLNGPLKWRVDYL